MNKLHRSLRQGHFIYIFLFTLQIAYAQLPYAGAGNWLELDGVDDYAAITDNSTLDVGIGKTDDFTVECFFYVQNLNGNNVQQLISKNFSYQLYINFNDSDKDIIYFSIYNGSRYLSCIYKTDLSVGWHHVASVFDNESKKFKDAIFLFLDGKRVKSKRKLKVKPGIHNSAWDLNIGTHIGLYEFFEGRIEEVRISDIVRYSGSGYTVPTSDFTVDGNTRALWHFNEASGATAFHDATENGNTLNAYNGVSAMPVELTGFTSKVKGLHVQLHWTTATEINNYGFNIERKKAGLPFEEWKTIGFVPGSGNSNSPKEYSFFNKYVPSGRYEYRLKQIDIDGGYEYSWIIEAEAGGVQEKIELHKNYPNPFNPSTIISFKINKSSFVSLKIFDVAGREIATIVSEELPAGNHSREWNAGGLSSGIYLYRLRAGSFCESRKLMLLK